MLNGLGMPARIARLTILAIIGLLLTFAMGVTSMGTMMVYCGLLHMYSNSLKGCRALLGKRVLLQFIGVPITLVIHLLLSYLLPNLMVQARQCIGAVIALPLLLTMNYKLKLGFSEVSQHVIVALITITFPSNPGYFVYRLLFTTLGVVIGYLTYKYVFPLRHDLAYEEKKKSLLDSLNALAQACLHGNGEVPVDLLASARAQALETASHLGVVCEDAPIKRQYAAYKGKTEILLWQQKVCHQFVEFFTAMSEGQRELSEKHLAYCRQNAAICWDAFQRTFNEWPGDEAFAKSAGAEKGNVQINTVENAADLRLSYTLETLRGELAAISKQSKSI